jgi:predicted alpha-1,6-mannanase (GH76 family)
MKLLLSLILPLVCFLANGQKKADSAFESFNAQFYNPATKLYYHASDKTGTGAIWTQAIFWDIAMHAYERNKKRAYRKLIDDIYEGAYNRYDGYNWNNTKEWFIYDDMMWWVIALARAHQITGEKKYLEKSISGFNRVWDGYDSVNGGMYWQFDHRSKHACINYPTVIAAMRLYKITKDKSYLDKAKNIYDWSQQHLNKEGRIADRVNRLGGRPGFEDYTYNQGTAIGAAVMLYKQTGEKKYLDDAKQAADYTKNKMCDSAGILPAEGDWNEQGVLKSIFAHYMFMLIKDAGQKQYLPWMQANATAAWQNRDKERNIMFRNYKIPCPTGKIQSYEASSGVALLQFCPPLNR